MDKKTPRSVSFNAIDHLRMADVALWSVDQVVEQLCSRDASIYSKLAIGHVDLKALEVTLRSNDVNGETLLVLNNEILRDDLHIGSFGQRREIEKIVTYLRKASEGEDKGSKRGLESEDEEISRGTPESQPDIKKRRVQPQLLSAEPVSKPISTPEEFDLENLTEFERGLLERYQEVSDAESLRPYNESDSELEIMSDDSLLDDLESEDGAERQRILPRLPSEEIYRIVDAKIEEYRQLWVANKQSKKHKKAFDRWMSAARARTRRPQQIALNIEIEKLQTRLAKFRKGIHDMNQDFHNVEDVKQICGNLQVTVEALAEQQYYLQVLDSDEPPVRPQALPTTVSALPDDLGEDEEILDSESESEQLEDDHFLDEVSNEESDVSLMYDPTDSDWNPQLPSEDTLSELELRPIEVLPEPLVTYTPTQPISMQYNVTPAPWPFQDPSNNLPPTLPKIRHETPDLLQVVQDGIENQMEEREAELDLLEEQLPQSRYRAQGATLDNAIDLGSSPASSDYSMTNSVHTPPLNPETPTRRVEPRSLAIRSFPDIRETRALKAESIGKDINLLLSKAVFKRRRSLAQQVLQHVNTFSDKARLKDALQATIAEWQDRLDDQIEEEDDMDDDAGIVWAYFFVVYASGRYARSVYDVSEESLDHAFEAAPMKATMFDRLLRPLLRYYLDTETETTPNNQQHKASTPFTQGTWQKQTTQVYGSQPFTVSTFRDRSKGSATPVSDTESELDMVPSNSQKRKRHVQQSQEAIRRQRDDQARVREEEEQRRQLLMMQKFQAVPGDDNVAPIPINTNEPIVYLDKHIAQRVKPHQVEGIQFIWRELVSDPKHQGCLLAHTMGLGKTMQVISFLVTLAQVNEDTRLMQHLPDRLRSKKYLVICPASLVDNWYDEFLMWSPPGSNVLGSIYRIQGTRKQKVDIVLSWSQTAGVLIVGYESMKAMLRKTRTMSDEEFSLVEHALLQQPCVVIADEAHKLKNTKSAVNKVAMQLTTTSRIALTGSPLNNHLEEYHTMINWIAPDYLGTLTQFRAKYSEPIERGLYADSSRYDKRKSLEKLYVLKRDLAPKINRKDISAIAKDMPQKTEFFITVPLTELQRRIYTTMVEHILRAVGSSNGNVPKSTNAQLWAWLSILSWLCNHPSCLIRKLEEKNPAGADPNTTSLLNLEKLNDDEFDEAGVPDNFNLTESPLSTLLPRFLGYFRDVEGLVYPEDPALSTRSMVTRLLIEQSIAQGDKILIFSHSIPTLDFLEGMVVGMGHDCMRIDGSTKTDQRQSATKYFNDEDTSTKVFLISTRAGGLGLNLQGANRVVIYDFGFNPSWEEQAIGRAYRLGQKKPVFVYRFRAGGTFEEAMYNKAIFKTQLFSRVVDQKNVIRHASKKIEDYLFVPRAVEKEDLTDCLGKDSLLDKIVEQIPDAIRGLLLTETFQREDEDDEMTPEEKQAADEAYRMEQLARSNPVEYQRAIIAKGRSERDRQIQAQQAMLSQYGNNKTSFAATWNAKTVGASGDDGRRDAQQGIKEGLEEMDSGHKENGPSCRNQ